MGASSITCVSGTKHSEMKLHPDMKLQEAIDEAILLSREADVYMVRGEPDRAKPLYLKAAQLLGDKSTESGLTVYQRAELTFSSAVLYFKAGDYYTTYSVMGSVNCTLIKADSTMFYEAKERASSGYTGNILSEVTNTEAKMRKGDKTACKHMLLLLRDNPHIIKPSRMAKLRYDALIALDMTEEAELFKPDMERLARKEKKPLTVMDKEQNYGYDDVYI